MDTLPKLEPEALRELLGIDVTSASPQRVLGTMRVTPQHLNAGGRVHAAAITALGDALGARGAILNVPSAHTGVTIESKTNFFSAAKLGDLSGEALPLHIGRTTMIWQTSIYDARGERVAMVTQTLIVLPATYDEAARPVGDAARAPLAAEPVATATPGSHPDTVRDRRGRIFDAARTVIAQKGFARATVRDIATAAGMPVPTMYQYIRSKEDVLTLIFETYVAELGRNLADAVQGSATATEKLRAAVSAHLAGFDKYHREIKLMFRETKSLSPEAQRRVLELTLGVSRTWDDIVRQGIETGEFELGHPEVVSHLIPMLCAAWPLRYWAIGPLGLEATREGILDLLLDGMRSRSFAANER